MLLCFDLTDMLDSAPQLINADWTRTWTISSAPPRDKNDVHEDGGGVNFVAARTVHCTIQRDGKRGAQSVSSMLHDALAADQASDNSNAMHALRPRFVGVGGEFTCFDDRGLLHAAPQLWLAAGSGVTPFLSMWSALTQSRGVGDVASIDVVMLQSMRAADDALAQPFANLLRRNVFVTRGRGGGDGDGAERVLTTASFDGTMIPRRMTSRDVAAVPKLTERRVFVCGPAPFLAAAQSWLAAAGVSADAIVTESFHF
jgi:hypothetical protein